MIAACLCTMCRCHPRVDLNVTIIVSSLRIAAHVTGKSASTDKSCLKRGGRKKNKRLGLEF